MLDPLSAFVFATLFSLLNGAVLGFIHPALTPDLRPSSADWRIGTLLVAGGAVTVHRSGATGANWVLPIANGAGWWAWLFIGVRSPLFASADSWWIYLPVLLVLSATPVSYTRRTQRRLSRRHRHRMLGGADQRRQSGRCCAIVIATVPSASPSLPVFILLAILMLARGPTMVGGPVVVSIAQPLNWVNALTPLLVPCSRSSAPPPLCCSASSAFAPSCIAQRPQTLTGLPNRRTIAERAGVLLARWARRTAAILCCGDRR